MDPNDPTRIQPAAEPHAQSLGAWPPPPPVAAGHPGGADAAATAAYQVGPPPAYVPPAGAGPYGAERARPPGRSRGLIIAGVVLALVLAGLVGFIVGVQVERGRNSSKVAAGTPSVTTPTTTAPRAGQGAGAAGGRSTAGLVGAVSSDGFTISLADGTSMNVVLSGRTRIVKTQAASTQDLTPGTRVTVVGARNQNGGITATMVTIGLARGAGAGGRTTTTTVP
jgi:hypothetical protein